MSQSLPVDCFKWFVNTFQFAKDFIENYNEESDVGYFFEVGIQYLEKLHYLLNDLSFLPERMKTEKK